MPGLGADFLSIRRTMYNTRRMVAIRPMRYERRDLQAGEEFDATQIDAGYLAKTKRAQFVIESVSQNENLVDNQQPATPRRRGRPPRQAMGAQQPAEPQTDITDETDGL